MHYIVSLLTEPKKVGLNETSVNSLLAQWNGIDLKWLNPECAAEFRIERIPSDYIVMWKEFNKNFIDLVITPHHLRKKKLLVADMDSTIIEQECLDELAQNAGIGDYVADITRQAMNGEIPFDRALHERVALLAGLSSATIEDTWQNRITFTSGARQLIATLKLNGCYCVLISGGFTAFTSRVSEALGFHEHFANVLLVNGDKLTGKVQRPVLDKEVKVKVLEQLTTQLGLTSAETLAVGDGANDLGMIKAAGLGVAFRSKPIVASNSDVRIEHSDLTSLLYLQGIKYADFVKI